MRNGIIFSINIENHFRYLTKVKIFCENEVENASKFAKFLTKVFRNFRKNFANFFQQKNRICGILSCVIQILCTVNTDRVHGVRTRLFCKIEDDADNFEIIEMTKDESVHATQTILLHYFVKFLSFKK